jgi:cobaltochelatase CobS
MLNPTQSARKAPSPILRQVYREAVRNSPEALSALGSVAPNRATMAELTDALFHSAVDIAGLNTEALRRAAAPDALQEAEVDDPEAEAGASTETEEAEPMAQDNTPDPIETELARVRSLIVSGGFTALDGELRSLITEARKPPVVIIQPADPETLPVPGTVPHSAPTGQRATWKALFGVPGQLGANACTLWDGAHPHTPGVNDLYVWPHPETSVALAALARKRHVFLHGPAGTGKTEFATQLAAKLRRPVAIISCDNGTEAATLTGMMVPHEGGGVVWQDGQLTKAIRTPGCVVVVDEPSVARPGALFVLQNVLANRVMYVAETGERVAVAPGVLFIMTDNTNGKGGGVRRGYTDTNVINEATLNRFAVAIRFKFMAEAAECSALVAYTHCTAALAALLVSAARTTRAAAEQETITNGIGFRRLLAWAEALTDGIDPETAFECCVLNFAKEQDVESLRQQCLLSYDRSAVAKALAPVPTAPTVETQPAPAAPQRERMGFSEFNFDPRKGA